MLLLVCVKGADQLCVVAIGIAINFVCVTGSAGGISRTAMYGCNLILLFMSERDQ